MPDDFSDTEGWINLMLTAGEGAFSVVVWRLKLVGFLADVGEIRRIAIIVRGSFKISWSGEGWRRVVAGRLVVGALLAPRRYGYGSLL